MGWFFIQVLHALHFSMGHHVIFSNMIISCLKTRRRNICSNWCTCYSFQIMETKWSLFWNMLCIYVLFLQNNFKQNEAVHRYRLCTFLVGHLVIFWNTLWGRLSKQIILKSNTIWKVKQNRRKSLLVENLQNKLLNFWLSYCDTVQSITINGFVSSAQLPQCWHISSGNHEDWKGWVSGEFHNGKLWLGVCSELKFSQESDYNWCMSIGSVVFLYETIQIALL